MGRAERDARIRLEQCHYCDQPGLTVDHIVPRVLGGGRNMWNLVPACHKCNKDKSDSWPSCECQKCRDAVRKHVNNPNAWAITKKMMAKREKGMRKRVSDVMFGLQRANDALEAHQEYVAWLESIRHNLTEGTTTDRLVT